MSRTLEPTEAERVTAFWRSFHPLHWVGVNVYKDGGGGRDDDDKDIGDEESGRRLS